MKATVYAEFVDYKIFHEESEMIEIPVHLHDTYEIFQSLNESLNYFVEGTIYTMNKYDVIITNDDEIHRPIITNKGTLYARRFIHFNPNAFVPFFNHDYNPLNIFEQRVHGQNNLIQFNATEILKVNERFTSIESFSHSDTFIDSKRHSLLKKSRIVDLMILLESCHSSSTTRTKNKSSLDPRINNIIHYIDSHYNEPLTLQHIAEYQFMDKYHLSHLFKNNTGFTVHEYIQSKRIKAAKRLIIEGHPMTYVCSACGYNDYSNFYKAFKKLTGQSPRDYV